ncbi:MAG: 30S ribosomal protein S20 [Patescibacteria group bacterium]|jgi:ribosomal protein S20
MPVTQSARKALRQNLKKAEANKPIRSRARTLLKKARQKPTPENIAQAFSSLDKAAKKNILPKGRVNRLKSRLTKTASKTSK